jgi:hypothetical protein
VDVYVGSVGLTYVHIVLSCKLTKSYRIILHAGGLLFSEGIGHRLKGLPVPVTCQSMSCTPTAITTRKSKATSSKPATAPAPTTGRQRQRQPPLTESKVESSRRLVGSISTNVLGKRSAASSSTEPEPELEPRTKRTRHAKDCDDLVPWPCTSASWNDPDALEIIYSDLRRHMCAVKRRIEELDKSAP